MNKRKFDIKKANRAKCDNQLKEKRDQRWLFTPMTESIPKRGHLEETSFDSILDTEGTCQEEKKQVLSSSSSTSSNKDQNEENKVNEEEEEEAKPKLKGIMVKTPTV